MGIKKVLLLNNIKAFFLFAVLVQSSTACGAVDVPHETVTPEITVHPHPSETHSTTPSILASETAIPMSSPQFWVENQQILESKGYSLQNNVDGSINIQQLDEGGKSWEVVRINRDGSSVIRTLDIHYRGSELTLSAEDTVRIDLVSLNAGHDQILVITNKDTGKVKRMFLPNIDTYPGSEAGWVAPIELSQDPRNPTRVDSVGAFHTRHVLYSALLDKGAEPWPDDMLQTVVNLNVAGQYIQYYDDKLGIAQLIMWARDSNGNDIADLQGRYLGWAEVNTPQGSIITSILEYKIGDDGESFVTNVGYSGDIIRKDNFYDFHAIVYRSPLLLYQAIGNEYTMYRGSWTGQPGVEYLYNNDQDNNPAELILDEVAWLMGLDKDKLQRDGVVWLYANEKWHSHEIIDQSLLDELETMILFPVFA